MHYGPAPCTMHPIAATSIMCSAVHPASCAKNQQPVSCTNTWYRAPVPSTMTPCTQHLVLNTSTMCNAVHQHSALCCSAQHHKQRHALCAMPCTSPQHLALAPSTVPQYPAPCAMPCTSIQPCAQQHVQCHTLTPSTVPWHHDHHPEPCAIPCTSP